MTTIDVVLMLTECGPRRTASQPSLLWRGDWLSQRAASQLISSDSRVDAGTSRPGTNGALPVCLASLLEVSLKLLSYIPAYPPGQVATQKVHGNT